MFKRVQFAILFWMRENQKLITTTVCFISLKHLSVPLKMFEREAPVKVSKGAKIRNRYNQVPHLTQDTSGKVTNLQLDTTNESQEVSPFPAGDHKAHINRRAQRHSKQNTEQNHKRSTKEVPYVFKPLPRIPANVNAMNETRMIHICFTCP